MNRRKEGALIQGYFSPLPAAPALGKRLASGKYRFSGGDLERFCSRCSDYWPADTEFFYTNAGDSCGLHCWCRACYEEARYRNGRSAMVSRVSTAPASTAAAA